MTIKYNPQTIESYPGLELMNPDSCTGRRVIQFKDIIRLPPKFIPGKFVSSVIKAYYGRLDSIDGWITPDGIDVNNGLHRALAFYVLAGQEGYLTIRSNSQREVDVPDNDLFISELEEFVSSEMLREIALEQINHLDKVEGRDFVRDVVKRFWNPYSVFNYLAYSSQDADIRSMLGSDKSGRKITDQHLARIMDLLH
jgi:hypothetical protein